MVACTRGIQKILAREEAEPSLSGESGPIVGKPPHRRSRKSSKTGETSEKKTKKTQKESVPKGVKKKKITKMGFVLTGLSSENKQMVHSSSGMIMPDKYFVEIFSEYDSTTCTHVITETNDNKICQRTIKYLFAVLDGKWIVNMQCIQVSLIFLGYLDSLSAGHFLPEEKYQVRGDQICGHTDAAKKGRLAPHSLFSGMSFFLEPNLDPKGPTKEELAILIKLGGGKLVARRSSIPSNCVVISSETDKKRLLDMISQYKR